MQCKLPMAARAVIICIEHQRLMQVYLEAILEYNRLSLARVSALLDGTQPPSLDEVYDAEARKDNAKYAILAHAEDHGC